MKFTKKITDYQKQHINPVVKFQKTIVDSNWLMVWLAKTNKSKINNCKSHREFQRVSEIRHENWNDHHQRKQKVVSQMKKHVGRMIICSIGVILIVLKLLYNRSRCSLPFFCSHPILCVILNRVIHFIAVDCCSAEDNQNMKDKRLRFDLFQLLHFSLKGFWKQRYALEETQKVEHHNVRKDKMIVNPLRWSL